MADFQDKITVERDGSAVVTERITLVFVGEWHGIHRTIPIEYPGPNGTNYELFLNVTSVTYDFHLAEGCANYMVVFTAAAAVLVQPNVTVKYNPAPTFTGDCK